MDLLLRVFQNGPNLQISLLLLKCAIQHSKTKERFQYLPPPHPKNFLGENELQKPNRIFNESSSNLFFADVKDFSFFVCLNFVASSFL